MTIAHTRRLQKLYEYRVVTSNGAGVYSKHLSCADAKKTAGEIAATWHGRGCTDMVFEISRMEFCDGGGHRYQMRQHSRWVPWDPHKDAEERCPDWVWRAA